MVRELIILALGCLACAPPAISTRELPRTSPGQVATLAQDTTFLCRSERPSIHAGRSVGVRVIVRDSTGWRFTWLSNTGRFGGTGSAVEWDSRESPIGTDTIRVRGTSPSGVTRECSVLVAVLPPDSVRGSRYSGRALLLRGRNERPDYGLYSYLLFRSPPGGATRDRDRAVLAAYLRLIESVTALEGLVDRSQLNITYVPVREPVRDLASADSLLARYDYARAQVMLGKIPAAAGDGPFLVSFRRPLSPETEAQPPMLVLNMTAVTPDVASLWVSEFLSQTAQERYWEEDAIRRTALRIRTILDIAGQGLPTIREQVKGWIEFLGGESK